MGKLMLIKRKTVEKGFTLIELLVVISIIAMLMAIMMPALGKARESARMTLCKTNLKQYGLAMDIYLSSYNEKYPPPYNAIFKSTVGGTPPACQWHDIKTMPTETPTNAGPLWAYLANAKSHLCPTFYGIARRYGAQHSGHVPSIEIEPQYSYSQNAFLGWMYKSTGSVTANPSGMAVFLEESMWQMMDGTSINVCSHVLNDTNFFARHPRDGTFPGDSVATYHRSSSVESKIDTSSGELIQTRAGGVGNAVFADSHIGEIDPYEHEMVNGARFNSSYLAIYPSRGATSANLPY
jgi:prepilin-type N-terminal cleavage/methylation domain-containing protein